MDLQIFNIIQCNKIITGPVTAVKGTHSTMQIESHIKYENEKKFHPQIKLSLNSHSRQ